MNYTASLTFSLYLSVSLTLTGVVSQTRHATIPTKINRILTAALHNLDKLNRFLEFKVSFNTMIWLTNNFLDFTRDCCLYVQTLSCSVVELDPYQQCCQNSELHIYLVTLYFQIIPTIPSKSSPCAVHEWDFRFPLGSRRELRSSGSLRSE
jgi:hypothetical protein